MDSMTVAMALIGFVLGYFIGRRVQRFFCALNTELERKNVLEIEE